MDSIINIYIYIYWTIYIYTILYYVCEILCENKWNVIYKIIQIIGQSLDHSMPRVLCAFVIFVYSQVCRESVGKYRCGAHGGQMVQSLLPFMAHGQCTDQRAVRDDVGFHSLGQPEGSRELNGTRTLRFQRNWNAWVAWCCLAHLGTNDCGDLLPLVAVLAGRASKSSIFPDSINFASNPPLPSGNLR